jgi:alpha-tubulin suppressor-like RCC1 family protein
MGDPVAQVQCGIDHTLVLTTQGQVFCCGSNATGQLGYEGGDTALLVFVSELNFDRIVKIRAGQYSAAMTEDGQIFIWGTGVFG